MSEVALCCLTAEQAIDHFAEHSLLSVNLMQALVTRNEAVKHHINLLPKLTLN